MDLAYRGSRHSVAVTDNIANHTPTYKALKYGNHSFDLDNELEHVLSKYGFVDDTNLKSNGIDDGIERYDEKNMEVQRRDTNDVECRNEVHRNSYPIIFDHHKISKEQNSCDEILSSDSRAHCLWNNNLCNDKTSVMSLNNSYNGTTPPDSNGRSVMSLNNSYNGTTPPDSNCRYDSVEDLTELYYIKSYVNRDRNQKTQFYEDTIKDDTKHQNKCERNQSMSVSGSDHVTSYQPMALQNHKYSNAHVDSRKQMYATRNTSHSDLEVDCFQNERANFHNSIETNESDHTRMTFSPETYPVYLDVDSMARLRAARDDQALSDDNRYGNSQGNMDERNELINVKKLQNHKCSSYCKEHCFYASINSSSEIMKLDQTISQRPLLEKSASFSYQHQDQERESHEVLVDTGSRNIDQNLEITDSLLEEVSGSRKVLEFDENLKTAFSAETDNSRYLQQNETIIPMTDQSDIKVIPETSNENNPNTKNREEPEKCDSKNNKYFPENSDAEDFDLKTLKEIVMVRYKALENMMEEALKKNMEIKEDKILSLQSRLDESKNRNVRLQEELRILKRECESLKQRYEEESVGNERHGTKVTYHGPLGAPRTTPYTQNTPTKEILDLKDHLIHLERANATLMTENKNMKSHTDSLNEQVQKLDKQNYHLQSQTSLLQEQKSSLQSQNAKIQVEFSTLQAQCSSLEGQCQMLQNKLNDIESEHRQLVQNYDELQTIHEQLDGDHVELQRIHEQLSGEYEALISEHGSLKSLHKSLKNENRELTLRLQDRNISNSRISEQEKDKINADLHSYENLKMEYSHMREKHDIVYNQHEKIRKDYLDLSKEHKQLKTDYNSLRGTCDEYKNQLHEMDLELNNLGHKYDSLYQVNQKMEDDNKNLLMQVQSLLNSNSDLLTQILNSKDTHAEEQKSYLEKLSDLKRQKERLEEKIMDAYKRQETQKKNKGLGARIARKAAKIFVSRPRSKSRNNLTDLSADNTSHGSGDITENGDSAKKSGLGRPANLGVEDDDDGGFGKRNSPSNEMLTLEQFLMESSKSSAKGNKSDSREDLESKSSENSDNSVTRRRRQAPNPPPDHRISIPDVVSQSQVELNLSRMSRISAGSSGSGYESRPDSLDQSTPPQSIRNHPETSTPAAYSNNIKKLEEAGYSPLTKIDFRKHSLGSTPSTATRTLQYSYPSPYKSPQNRELPPTPNDGVTPSERLDRLAGFSPSQNTSNSSSLYNNQDSSVQYDHSIRSGPTSRYRAGSPVRSNQTFSPGVQQGRQQGSPASYHNSSPQTNGQLPPSGPLTRGHSLNRPQTVHESQQNNIYFSIDDNKQSENRPENHYGRVQRIERPKSVPPNMFEALQNQENVNNRPTEVHNKGTPPKPPPRRSREPGLTTGRVSLLREPVLNRSGGRQLPQSDTYRSSTPTLRKDAPPRQTTEEPPKDPKANSVWR